MRRFLIRNFVLFTTVRGYPVERFLLWIVPATVLLGIILLLDGDVSHVQVYEVVASILWSGCGLIPMLYLSRYPAKWEEMDDFQKFVYGRVSSQNLTKPQLKEWVGLQKRFET